MQEQFDFIVEAEKTASPFFHIDKVPAGALYIAMRKAVRALDVVDRMRNAVFYESRDFDNVVVTEFNREYPNLDPHIIHGILGAACEGGEKLDLLVRTMDGEPFDAVNYGEEVGDGWWYDAIALSKCGYSVEQIMKTTIEKIRARTGDSFTKQGFNERDLLTERDTLENGLLPDKDADGRERVQKG